MSQRLHTDTLRRTLLIISVAALAMLGSVSIAGASVTAPNPYGTEGNGNPHTADCASQVHSGQSINVAITAAQPRAVLCVRPGDYHTQVVRLNKTITLRAVGKATISSAVVTGNSATLDGFTVVGTPKYAETTAGILFAGHGQTIVRNLVNGRELAMGIQCPAGSCNSALVRNNTVTTIQNYGLFIDAGQRSIIEWNNIYDLHTESHTMDVDGIRFFGDHVFRNNYIHDINQFKSAKDPTGDTPHTDCFQTYNTGAKFSGTLIEDNYCLRVSRQCLIAQNDTAKTYEIQDIVFRNNICETYDSQGINLGSMRAVKVQNNLILSGYRFQVISLEEQETGLANTDTQIINNILVRATKSAFTYERIGRTTHEHFRNNLEMLDTSIAHRDPDFQHTRNAYPAYTATDFTAYRNYLTNLEVMDRGVPGNGARTDIAGAPRLVGPSIDLGPFELGTCGQRC